MAVIGIITCETQGTEFVYLLAKDHKIDGITVLENNTSRHLIQALGSKGIQNMQQAPHIKNFRPGILRHPEVLIRVPDLSVQTGNRRKL